MKLDNIFGPQTWSVIMIVGGIIWLGWFLSSDIDQNSTEGTEIEGVVVTENRVDGSPPPEFGVVSDVVDSLTLVLDNKFLVRYLGVTTPTTLDKVECFGKEALQANESLVGKTVRLEEDPVLGRALDQTWVRYVWVAEDEKSQEAYAKALSGAPVAGLNMPNEETEVAENTLIEPNEVVNGSDEQIEDNTVSDDGVLENDEEQISEAADEDSLQDESQPEEERIKEYLVSERIIEMGLGFPLLSQDMIYHEKLSAAARFSSATKRGLWGACEISEGENSLLKTQEVTDCLIKGVKLLDGQQVFRTPECKAYKNTVVLKYKGDEWLCSEDAALEKGFVKAIDC